LVPAIEALVERRRENGLEITTDLALSDGDGLAPDLETTVYRLVQEALTNVVKHAHASSASVSIQADNGELSIDVRDDGRGFDVGDETNGFGLTGVRERIYLADGTLRLESDEAGTAVSARLPVKHRSEQPSSRADQLAS
jgi:signal transduction histidine kinase